MGKESFSIRKELDHRYAFQERGIENERLKDKLGFNFLKSHDLDQTEEMDLLSKSFNFESCKNEYWNPEEFSLLYASPLWEGATERQRIILNQMYWVAYYSQIISAEIATIYFNQTCAAGLYAIEGFRRVCNTLDLESQQERAHINAFKVVCEDTEMALFGERLFTYPMRGPFVETMIFRSTGFAERHWRRLGLYCMATLSSSRAFIASQYFTVRGLRTLNGKMIQHRLSQYYTRHPDKVNAPNPSRISYCHFIDESFHFNTSLLISKDVYHEVPNPKKWESFIVNLALEGTQRDHSRFSTIIDGIFWDDTAALPTIYKMLRSAHFSFSHKEALNMLFRCFGEENEAMRRSQKTHSLARESYAEYVSDFSYLNQNNKMMKIMGNYNLESHLERNRRALKSFAAKPEGFYEKNFLPQFT